MNKQENKLFDLLILNEYDMEDLIETIPYKVVDDLIEVWEERVKEN